jgi:hypothetical protein
LDDLPDLIGRLRALADPGKSSWNWDRGPVVASSGSTEAPAPISDNLADAIIACESVWSWWMSWGEDLPLMSNRTDAMWLFDLILDEHKPDEKGIREGWSVLDAMRQWGPERRPGKHEKPWEDDDDAELATFPIPEWGGLVTREDAAKIAGSRPTLYRWVADNKLRPAMDYRNGDGTKTTLFRASDVERVREEMAR